MGASAHEIEQQIKETRERMDENLGTLEDRATSGARRYGKIAAVVVVAAAVAGAGFLIWRRTRRPTTLRDRLDRLSLRSLRDLSDEVTARLKKPLPSVKVTVTPANEAAEPGMVKSIVRRVAPAVVGTAATGLLRRVSAPPDAKEA